MHSEIRYEFLIISSQPGQRQLLLRAPDQQAMETWLRNLHMLMLDVGGSSHPLAPVPVPLAAAALDEPERANERL